MPPGPVIAAIAVIVTSIGWSVRLVGDPSPFASGPAAMLALVAIAMSLIAAAGLLLARGRWALWLVLAIVGAQLMLATTLDLSATGVVIAGTAVVVQVVAALAAGRSWMRTSPNPQGPPPLSVGLLLALLGFPALVAAANSDGISVTAVAGAALTASAAVVYSRSGVPALWALRALVPPGAVLAVIATPLPGSLVVAGVGLGVVGASWSPVVRNAAAPLVPLRSPGYKIPPELAPREVLDAAGIDEKGRRRR
jgi:hypothetical protein